MYRKIQCDEKSEKFYKIFQKLNKVLMFIETTIIST